MSDEITDVTRKYDDVVIESSYVEEKEHTEEEIKRWGYENTYLEDWVDDTLTINAFELSDMRVEQKTSKKGNTYTSSKCILVGFCDEQEIKITTFVENFGKYDAEEDVLIVQGKNVLARLAQKLLDSTDNRFKLNYSKFVELVNDTEDVTVTVRAYPQGEYLNYTIE